MVGPDLSTAGLCLKPEEVVESVLWPRRQVKEGLRGLHHRHQPTARSARATSWPRRRRTLEFRDPASGDRFQIAKADIEELRQDGTLMPDGLAAAMSPADRRDLVRFLLDLGRPGGTAAEHAACGIRTRRPSSPSTARRFTPSNGRAGNSRSTATASTISTPRRPSISSKQPSVPSLLPPFPGLDGGEHGHWGNQNEETWADGRWNQTDLGTVLCGVFRGAGVTVPKGVCVRLGDSGELAACFNPETLCYEALWNGDSSSSRPCATASWTA